VAESSSAAPGLFETLGLHDGEILLWDLHLARLAAGAKALGIPFDPPRDLRAQAQALLAHTGDDVLRITLAAGTPPRWTLASRKRDARSPLRLAVSPLRRARDDHGGALKSTARGFYEQAIAASPGSPDDVVILDTFGTVLETTRCNLFLWRGGELCTPAINGLFLPGIARQLLLAHSQARERNLTFADLQTSDAILVTNAVHGPRVAFLDGARPAADNPLTAPWHSALAALRSDRCDRR
jgi:branched-subunit amino acid aminotransferase/4-amino-4-deoxychorismate lyase